MSREENVEIFNDTEKLCKTNPFLIQAWKYSSENQKLILEDEAPETEARMETRAAGMASTTRAKATSVTGSATAKTSATVKVTKNRTFQAAMEYKSKKVAVLNFASATTPGGGVVKGSSAQEECLCRCSTLYYNLTEDYIWKNFYLPHRRDQNPIHNDDLIYTPDVVIFKSDTSHPNLLAQDQWKKVNVITCAAPNLRERPSNGYNSGEGDKSVSISDDELEQIHIKRGRKILQVAATEENQVVILGAFGCGAFMNKPEVVAKAYAKLLEEFKNSFETIEFAVYCPAWDDTNFRVFNQILNPKNANNG